jgi:hypothetical protein
MDKSAENIFLKVLVCGVIGLALGALFGYMVKAPVVDNTKVNELQLNLNAAYNEVARLTTQLSTAVEPEVVEVEVVKEVVVEANKLDLRDKAIDEFMGQLEDNDLLVCNGVEYDEDQVKISKSYEDFTVIYGKDTEEIFAKVKLKYLDSDTEVKCYETYDFSVLYEEDEDPVVSLEA